MGAIGTPSLPRRPSDTQGGIASPVGMNGPVAEEFKNLLSMAVEQSPVAIAITDLDGHAQYVNVRFTKISGLCLEEIRRKDILLLKEGHPSEESYQRMLESVGNGQDWRGEFSHLGSDGRRIWESAHVSCLKDEYGVATGLLCQREDITASKQLENELRQSQKMESLGTLAGGIAHDFNNLLAVIIGYIELCTVHSGNEAMLQKSLGEIKRATQRAISLVRQILMFSRKADLRVGPIDLNQLVREMSAMLLETFPRNVIFQLNLDESVPPLLGDSNQLQQVLLNLCVNARDAMPKGGTLTIATGCVSGGSLPYSNAARDRDYVRLIVSDTGTGMPPEVRTRIFEPFFTTKQAHKGTGLGLSVVYGIVSSHEGFIECDSTPGTGSVFTVLIPVADASTLIPPSEQMSAFPSGTERILVVDDEASIRNLLTTAFTCKGYEVFNAADGLEAIDAINDTGRSFDAVLLDLNMPGVSGIEVLRVIRAQRPKLPVLMLSGHVAAEARAALEKLGQRDFAMKPYSLDEIGRKVRGFFDETPSLEP